MAKTSNFNFPLGGAETMLGGAASALDSVPKVSTEKVVQKPVPGKGTPAPYKKVETPVIPTPTPVKPTKMQIPLTTQVQRKVSALPTAPMQGINTDSFGVDLMIKNPVQQTYPTAPKATIDTKPFDVSKMLQTPKMDSTLTGGDRSVVDQIRVQSAQQLLNEGADYVGNKISEATDFLDKKITDLNEKSRVAWTNPNIPFQDSVGAGVTTVVTDALIGLKNSVGQIKQGFEDMQNKKPVQGAAKVVMGGVGAGFSVFAPALTTAFVGLSEVPGSKEALDFVMNKGNEKIIEATKDIPVWKDIDKETKNEILGFARGFIAFGAINKGAEAFKGAKIKAGETAAVKTATDAAIDILKPVQGESIKDAYIRNMKTLHAQDPAGKNPAIKSAMQDVNNAFKTLTDAGIKETIAQAKKDPSVWETIKETYQNMKEKFTPKEKSPAIEEGVRGKESFQEKTQENPQLIEEAKKYKSAESFVKNTVLKGKKMLANFEVEAGYKLRGDTNYDGALQIHEMGDTIYLTNISLNEKSTGLGTEVVKRIKAYADATQKDLQIVKSSNDPYRSSFPFLKQESASKGFRYEPSKGFKEFSRIPSGFDYSSIKDMKGKTIEYNGKKRSVKSVGVNQDRTTGILHLKSIDSDSTAAVRVGGDYKVVGEANAPKFQEKTPETKDLKVIHNTSLEKLKKTMDLGGMPGPSLAITSKDIPFEDYGDITFIADKDLIDPSKSKKNIVGSADIYTPTVPDENYVIKKGKEISKKIDDIATKLDMPSWKLTDYMERWGDKKYILDDHPELKPFESEIESMMDKKLFDKRDYYGNKKYKDYTLDNVVTKMFPRGEDISTSWAGGLMGGSFNGMMAKLATKYKNIKEIKKTEFTEKGKLDSEYERLQDEYYKLTNNIDTKLLNEFIQYPEETIVRKYNEESTNKIDIETVKKIKSMVQEGLSLGKSYIEAKVKRGVGVSEFKAVAVPKDKVKEVTDIFKNKGIDLDIIEYDPKITGDRTKKINDYMQEKDLFFQEKGKAPKKYNHTITQEQAKKMILDNPIYAPFIKEIGIEFVDRIVTPRGLEAFGKYKDGMVSFAKDPQETTPPHEMLHGIFDLFVPAERQLDVIKQIKQEQGLKTSTEAEERLADKWVEYARDVDRLVEPKQRSAKIMDFFQEMRTKIKALFRKPDHVELLFRDIAKGNLEYLKKGAGEVKFEENLSLYEEARKYKSAEEFVDSKLEKQDYRSAHQLKLSDSITADSIDVVKLKEQIRTRRGYISNDTIKGLKKLEKLQGNPEMEITIYRASPKEGLNDGDWVTIDKVYATDIKRQNGGKVFSYTAKVGDLRFPTDVETLPSLAMESTFSYSPETARLKQIREEANAGKFQEKQLSTQEKKMVELAGTTTDPKEVGFITSDGKWTRKVHDHAEVAQAVYGDVHDRKAVQRYIIDTNNIRAFPYGGDLALEFVEKPTQTQMQSIARLYKESGSDKIVTDTVDKETLKTVKGETFDRLGDFQRYVDNMDKKSLSESDEFMGQVESQGENKIDNDTIESRREGVFKQIESEQKSGSINEKRIIKEILRIKSLEDKVGKVGSKEVSKEYREKQEREIIMSKEKIIKDIKKEYDLDNNQALEKYDELLESGKIGKAVNSMTIARNKGNYDREALMEQEAKRIIKEREDRIKKKNIGLSNLVSLPENKKLTKEFYDKQLEAKQPKRKNPSDRKKSMDYIMKPISERLGDIAPEIKVGLRKYEMDKALMVKKDIDNSRDFLDKGNALRKDKKAYEKLEYALLNQDMETVREMGIEVPRKVLDNALLRARDSGFDVGYVENYFPRSVKDAAGLLGELEHTGDRSSIQEAFKNMSEKLGRDLSIEEKAEIANKLIQGYTVERVTIGSKNFKERGIEVIDAKLKRFYHDAIDGYLMYISSVNDAIAMKDLFGTPDPEKSIGNYIARLVDEGKIDSKQEREVMDMLNARFNPKGKSRGWISTYKSIIYLTTMASPISAISQIQDLSFSVYEGGVKNVAKSWIKGLPIKMEDIGLSEIYEEFSEKGILSGAVNKSFKAVGLEALDRLGKQTLINSYMLKLQDMATKRDPELNDLLEGWFGNDGPAKEKVIRDLQTNTISNEVKLILFSKVCDIQPMTKSESPEAALRNPNARIAYVLKNFTLKQLEFFRREGFKIIGEGNKIYKEAAIDAKEGRISEEDMKTKQKKGKEKIVKGVKNLLVIRSLLFMGGVTTDEIKDFVMNRSSSNIWRAIRGEDMEFGGRITDNMLKLLGFSKYSIYQASKEGILKTIGAMILPPTGGIDNVWKDMNMLLYKDEDPEKNLDRGQKLQALNTVQNIPLFGKLLYRWLGQPTMTKKGGSIYKDIFTGAMKKRKGTSDGEGETTGRVRTRSTSRTRTTGRVRTR